MRQLDFDTAKLILEVSSTLRTLKDSSPVVNHLDQQGLKIDWDAINAVEREATIFLIKYYADHLLSVNRPETGQNKNAPKKEAL